MMRKAMFGAGCFWGVEHRFRQVRGVADVEVGYSGGTTENATYKQVCTGRTGHAEVVRLDFDDSIITYEELLRAFWDMHDPTTLNRQGPDRGTQYRSVVFYYDEAQRLAAERMKAELQSSMAFVRPIVTQILPAGQFWRAEDYHQRYFEKNGAVGCHI